MIDVYYASMCIIHKQLRYTYNYTQISSYNAKIFYCRNIERKDQGKYVCRAGNEGGFTKQSVYVTVQGKGQEENVKNFKFSL